jgi:hypothetical protein
MTKFCPLCKKVLLEIGGKDDRDYICQTRVKLDGFTGMYGSVPHYEDRADSRYIVWIALPYKITTTTEDHRSCIYMMRDDEPTEDQGINPKWMKDQRREPKWKEIATTSEIHPDTPERLAKRIKLLVPFT